MRLSKELFLNKNLSVNAEKNHHREENYSPKIRKWHKTQSRGICHKGQFFQFVRKIYKNRGKSPGPPKGI
jgi:hypothetical protein